MKIWVIIMIKKGSANNHSINSKNHFVKYLEAQEYQSGQPAKSNQI